MKKHIVFLFLAMNFMTLPGQSLSQHQWKDRLILIFSPEFGNLAARQQLDELQAVSAALADRDLLIYRISPVEVYGPQGKLDVNANQFYENYRVGTDEFNLILIGKDGGEKLRSEGLIDPDKIFDLIDKMPMRQAEMKKKDGRKDTAPH